MSDEEVAAAARLLRDEQAVRDACMKYWAGVDRRDNDLVREAFVEDAQISLFGGTRVVSVDDLLGTGSSGGIIEHSSHTPGSQVVTVDGDTATADTMVTAVQVLREGPILVRGLRYRDSLVRRDDEWRIKLRDHETLWQYDVTRVEPHLPRSEP
jgi:hypothetical protein